MSNQNTFRYNNKTNASVVLKSKLLCDFEQNFCVSVEEIINLVPITTFAELVARLAIPGISGIIYLSSGTFTATETLVIPTNITLKGVGNGTLFNVNTNITNLFNITGSNVSLKDFSVDMNSTGGTTPINCTEDIINLTISNLNIIDVGGGQYSIDINSPTSSSDININNCVLNGHDDGIHIVNANNVVIINTKFYNGVNTTISLSSVNDFHITNNYFELESSINIDGVSTNGVVSNNTFSFSIAEAVIIADSTVINIIISGNNVSMGNDDHIISLLNDTHSNLNINSNLFDNSTGTSSIISVPTATDTLENIVIIDNTQADNTAQYLFQTVTPQTDTYTDVMIRNTVKYVASTVGSLGTLASAQLTYAAITTAGALTGTLLTQIQGPSLNKLYLTVAGGGSVTYNAVDCTACPDTAFFPTLNTITSGTHALFMWTGFSYILIFYP